MAFCENCGLKINDTTRFCPRCGAAAHFIKNEEDSFRREVYNGIINKCPNCGEVLDSFEALCPACGYELRGAKGSKSVSDFALRIENAETIEKQMLLIRNYPIPNTKEDIFEYLILASSNIMAENNRNVFDAWIVKFDQCYHKAKLVLGNEDFEKFQIMYFDTKKQIKRKKWNNAKNNSFSNVDALPQIILSLGWVIAMIVILFVSSQNHTEGWNGAEMVFLFLFPSIFGLTPIVLKGKSSIPRAILALGLIIIIVYLFILNSMYSNELGISEYSVIIIFQVPIYIIMFILIIKGSIKNKK